MWFLLGLLTLSITNVLTISEHMPVVHLEVKEESTLHTTIGNISTYLVPEPRIVTDSLFFNVTPSGLIQLTRRLDLEALCTEKFLCCEHEKPCELVSNIVVESQLSRDLETLELRVHVLDVNDNPPTFPFSSRGGQYLEVSELTKVGSVFDLTSATDRDVTKENQVQRYMLHGTSIQNIFALEKSDVPTARLRLLQPLDYERVKKYTGIIEACDPQTCTQQNLTILVIDANDNNPFFKKRSYELTIPENFTVGSTVVQLEAEDHDSPLNARMEFRFHGEVDVGLQKTFRLERDTGRLVLKTHLAAHRRSEYRFEVSVVEAGQGMQDRPSSSPSSSQLADVSNIASVIIKIEDLNDFSPTIKLFSPSEGQRLSIPENSPAARICVLQVTDNDAGDNGRVVCRLNQASSAASSLTLTGSGKMYTLTTSRSFDAEQEPQVTVTVHCQDHGDPPRSSSRDLIIYVDDVNEYPPELEQTTYHAAIYENSAAGVEVVRVIAHDRDHNSKLHYELSAEGRQYFKVDPTTGSIMTLGESSTGDRPERTSLVLDREKSERITFVVCVSDGPIQVVCDSTTRSGESQQTEPLTYTVRATVFVTVLDQNDNRPAFIETGPFSVAENQPRFTEVTGKLLAMDPDEGDNGRVRYSLRHVWRSATHIPAPDLFQLHLDGRIQTLEVLDRELTNLYTLEVSACDSAPQNPLCTRTNLTVTIQDENDNKPVWRYPHEQDKEVNITSDLPAGHVVARVHATDRDVDENGRIVYSLIDPLRRTVFEVDNKTGDVLVAQSPNSLATQPSETDKVSPLIPGIYRLRMKASDMGHPQQTAETWLQVNVFNADTGVTTGMNFMIIVIMVAVTGLISICLVVAIICVRRRSSLLRVNRNGQATANGYRRGRDAGDGAEGVHFPLKTEYGFPVDGYMMGVSPTPSDLDTLKLGYTQTNTTLPPYLGITNGVPDAAHLLGWPPGTICYATDDGCLTEHGIPTELSAGQSIRLPVYAPYQFNSPSGSDPSTVRSGSHNGPRSVTCLSFAAPSPAPDQIPTSSGMLTFTSAYSERPAHMGSEDGTLVNGKQSGLDCLKQRAMCGVNTVYDVSGRQLCVPPISGGNNTTNRRGITHCEMDVDSADSGKGASEDDPSLFTGLIHLYPAYQLTALNGALRDESLQPTPEVKTEPSVSGSWNSSERSRLKC